MYMRSSFQSQLQPFLQISKSIYIIMAKEYQCIEIQNALNVSVSIQT